MFDCDNNFLEIAREAIGRSSGVTATFLVAFAITGILVLYMILFSKICISLFGV